ncbi:MAG: GIY-YIG nuclease family protein [Oscillospiraceae bacterium]|nr:GIY-YIG nuclease family protein [Oscillospiraceae bacterium]
MSYYVYILRCTDNTLYTGWTTDLDARLESHNNGTGAKYTRGRGPLELVYTETLATKPAAMQREYAIKQLSRSEKLALCKL